MQRIEAPAKCTSRHTHARRISLGALILALVLLTGKGMPHAKAAERTREGSCMPVR